MARPFGCTCGRGAKPPRQRARRHPWRAPVFPNSVSSLGARPISFCCGPATSTSDTRAGADRPCGVLGALPRSVGAVPKLDPVAARTQGRRRACNPQARPKKAIQAATATALAQPTRDADPSPGVPHAVRTCGEVAGSRCSRTSSAVAVAAFFLGHNRCRPSGRNRAIAVRSCADMAWSAAVCLPRSSSSLVASRWGMPPPATVTKGVTLMRPFRAAFDRRRVTGASWGDCCDIDVCQKSIDHVFAWRAACFALTPNAPSGRHLSTAGRCGLQNAGSTL